MNKPKGFGRKEDAATAAPKKNGSVWTPGTYNNDLGSAWSERYNRYASADQAWLLYKTESYSGTGKKFTFDLAFFGGPSYFDFTGPRINLYIRFYNCITKKRENTWHKIGGPYNLSTYRNSIPGASQAAWDNYSSFGSHKPAYGMVVVSGVSPYGKSYSTYCNDCIAAGADWFYWDRNPYYNSFTGRQPLGVRYVSNNGTWNGSRQHVNPDGVVPSDYYNHRSLNWSQTNEDGGNTPSNYKSFTIDENFIKQCCGASTGITAFQLRLELTGDGWDDPDYWYFGCSDDNKPENGTGIWTMIENPRLGLLDWGEAGSPVYWPERYDAKAYYSDAGSSVKKELAAQYAPKNGSWGMF